MTTFVLIPGAGGAAAYWYRVVPELERRGHEAIAVDIRAQEPPLGLPEFADLVESAIGEREGRDVILVAQSMGAFTAPVVAARRPVRMIVLLNPMTPAPGESAGDWWENTGAPAARIANDRAAGRDDEFDIDTHFFHDVPPDVVAALGDREPADAPFDQPCEIERWPDVPTRALVGRDDRFFPLELQRRVIAERVGVAPDEIAGGHLAALSNPVEVAQRLSAYATD